jgi:ATP-binding protein involved in chromosome partitioning
MRLLPRARGEVEIDHDAVRSAVASVRDPELGLGLEDAGMLQDVSVSGSGTVRVSVNLTTPACPMKEQLSSDIQVAVTEIPGVSRVEVTFGAMSEGEKIQLSGRLRGDRVGHPFGPDSSTAVYAVASGKGGVGKSSVTANLAVALAAQGKRVGVLDADVWGWSMPQLFGVRRAPVAIKGLMLPVESHNVQVMSVGFFVSDDEPVIWRGPMLHKALEQFLGDVHWGELDVLLIDLPPGTGDIQISLLELVPDAQMLLVTTPQQTAVGVAERVGVMARNQRVPIAGVIENMSASVCGHCGRSTSVFGSGGGRALAEKLDVALLGSIPLDEALVRSGDSGVPVVVAEPGAVSSATFLDIAAELPVVKRSLVGRSLPLSVV